MSERKRVCILGLGYIGLPTAAVLSQAGFECDGVDIVEAVVDTINNGDIHIVEPGLEAVVKQSVEKGLLKALLKPCDADVFIIAVPTPFYEDSKKPNIEYVLDATKAIAPHVKPGNLVILESTSPVGTTEKVAQCLEEKGVDISQISIAYCPERVLPGQILYELVHNDRIVGGLDKSSTKQVALFYKQFVKGEVLETEARTAELSKLTENAFRDVNIAFANEMSMVCDELEVDVWALRELVNHHPRVNMLMPGCGVGGHCIAVDPWFIVDASKQAKLVKLARERNLSKTDWVIAKIKQKAVQFEKENGRSPVIACLGATFKPDVDDCRESPALFVIRMLAKDLAVKVVEPHVSSLNALELVSYERALDMADLTVVLVAHNAFKCLTGFANLLDFTGFIGELSYSAHSQTKFMEVS